jgi:hypothetical protein
VPLPAPKGADRGSGAAYPAGAVFTAIPFIMYNTISNIKTKSGDIRLRS